MRQFRKYFPKSTTERWTPWYCNPHLDDEKVRVWRVRGKRHWEAGGNRKWEKKDG
jgi:hypothetical protein